MTDEHGSESQPVHEDAPAEEHQTHEAEGGGWSDDHPPVDDFADPGSANEEMATASHEVATEADETASSSASAPSRSMLPLFAGIGGVLLIGAVVYWQFGHSSPPPVAMAQTSSPKSSLSAPVRADSKPSVAATTTSAAQDTDIASLYKPTSETPPPMPPKETAPSGVPVMPASATPASGLAPALPPQAIVPVAPVIPVAPVAPPSAAADARIDTINARIDSLQKSIGDATRQLNQLSNMVAANQAMPPVSSQVNPALEDRLNKIEQNLMQVEHNTAKPPPAEVRAETAEPSATTTVKTVSHHVKSSPKHATHHVSKKIKTRSKPSSEVAAIPRNSTPWILRAATPNEAWVSADANSAELRHVQVGDSLSGVGQIRAIRQTMSGWEIEGTAGTVR